MRFHSPQGIVLSQEGYISDIMHHADISDEKTMDIPLQQNLKLRLTNGDHLVNLTHSRHIVSQLVYLCISKLDISHTIGVVCEFIASPHTNHYITRLWILRYSQGKVTCSLSYVPDNFIT